jgi:carbonic anhydrase/acetyltransferase-like protein (isoleucine patch superfamily)
MPIYQLGDRIPRIHPAAFIHESAVVIGDVIIGARASVWPFSTLRGDNEPITVGADSNVQESCTLHTDPGFPLLIGERVTVGHHVMLHGCTIGDESLIGIQAVVLNGAVIGRQCLVGAASLVTEGKSFADGSLILGSPGRLTRALQVHEIERSRAIAQSYAARGAQYRDSLVRIG